MTPGEPGAGFEPGAWAVHERGPGAAAIRPRPRAPRGHLRDARFRRRLRQSRRRRRDRCSTWSGRHRWKPRLRPRARPRCRPHPDGPRRNSARSHEYWRGASAWSAISASVSAKRAGRMDVGRAGRLLDDFGARVFDARARQNSEARSDLFDARPRQAATESPPSPCSPMCVSAPSASPGDSRDEPAVAPTGRARQDAHEHLSSDDAQALSVAQ